MNSQFTLEYGTGALTAMENAAAKLRYTFGNDRLSPREALDLGEFCVAALIPFKGYFPPNDGEIEPSLDRQKVEITILLYTGLVSRLSCDSTVNSKTRYMMAIVLRLLEPDSLSSRDMLYMLFKLTGSTSRATEEDISLLLQVLNTRSTAFMSVVLEINAATDRFLTAHPHAFDISDDEASETSAAAVKEFYNEAIDAEGSADILSGPITKRDNTIGATEDNAHVTLGQVHVKRTKPIEYRKKHSHVHSIYSAGPYPTETPKVTRQYSPYSLNESDFVAIVEAVRLGILSRIWANAALALFTPNGPFRHVFPMTRAQLRRICGFLVISSSESHNSQLDVAVLVAREIVFSLRGHNYDETTRDIIESTPDTEVSENGPGAEKSKALVRSALRLKPGAERAAIHPHPAADHPIRRDRETLGHAPFSSAVLKTDFYPPQGYDKGTTLSLDSSEIVTAARALLPRINWGADLQTPSLIAEPLVNQSDPAFTAPFVLSSDRVPGTILHAIDAVHVAASLAKCGTTTGHFLSYAGNDTAPRLLAEAIGLALALHLASPTETKHVGVAPSYSNSLAEASDWILFWIRDPALRSMVLIFLAAHPHTAKWR